MANDQHSCAVGEIRGNVLIVTVLLEQIRDPKTSYALRDEILSLLEAGEIRHVAVDLGRVTFMGSVGLLALLTVRRQIPDGDVVLCNLSEAIHDMLEVCMLISANPIKTAPFQAAESVAAALKQLQAK